MICLVWYKLYNIILMSHSPTPICLTAHIILQRRTRSSPTSTINLEWNKRILRLPTPPIANLLHTPAPSAVRVGMQPHAARLIAALASTLAIFISPVPVVAAVAAGGAGITIHYAAAAATFSTNGESVAADLEAPARCECRSVGGDGEGWD